MSQALDELIDVLSLTPREDPHVFAGKGSSGDGAAGTFGGQFLGQAAAAAIATVDGSTRLHSLHGYFLRGGQPGVTIDYRVELIRDGRTFATRMVHAYQGSRHLFQMLASFTSDVPAHEFAPTPPPSLASAPDPLSLPTYETLMRSLDPLPLPAGWALREHGMDVRVINAPWTERGPSTESGIRMWIKAGDTLPDIPSLHTALLAYQSDESIADNVLVPFGLTWSTPELVFVSLDHAMWFHSPPDLNAWHFVEQRPLVARGGRGTAFAQVWRADGTLVATFTQEALMRPVD
jgi:acyl-CoA thioesterase II